VVVDFVATPRLHVRAIAGRVGTIGVDRRRPGAIDSSSQMSGGSTTTTKRCAECGKPTANPKFCDKSCAARFNNRRTPKRKPEGKCGGCGAPVTSGKRRCLACLAADAEAAKVRAEGIITVRRLDGSMERVKTKPMSLRTRTVVQPVAPKRLALSTPAARVFELVLGLLADGPEWLRPVERARYSTLFRDFARFPVRTRGQEDPTERLPTEELPRAAIQWLDALATDDDPLLLSFGFDAVEFFFELVTGRHGYGSEPDLEPIIDIQPPIERGYFSDKRSMRKRYTERVLGRLPVVACIPLGGSIRRENGDVLISGGELFGVQIVRCHLSENPAYETTRLDVEWPRLKPFDRATEFSFRSRLLVARTDAGQLTPWAPGMRTCHDEGPLLDLPAHWITGILDMYDDPLAKRPTPVRSWTV